MSVAEFKAPAHWRAIDLLSDLHLSEATPRTFDAWAAHLRHTPADAVFMLGDLFDAWVGDDARTSGFEYRCAEVLREAAGRRTLAFMVGNRDFLVGAELLGECGVMALADPTVLVAFGERWLLSHGDALCLEDTEYQRFRAQVRSPAWQAATLARPLAERRALAQQIRTASRERKAQMAK
ncbi:MAG TPA: UDP-2,3-diacylglucosamine diphosphatase, partial [Burkholderiaceae bacterium]|nr:UDP-2,3-diacylglucosamine diphosphatase [Burkholderiaceae bacterium]